MSKFRDGVEAFDLITNHVRGPHIQKSDLGKYVLASDYDTLAAELAAIRAAGGEEVEVVAWRCEATKPGIKTQRRIVEAWAEAESFALHYEERGCKVTTTAMVEKSAHKRIVAAMAAELATERARADAAVGDANEAERELAAIKAQEPVMWVNPNVIGADLKINWPTAITFSNRGPCHGWTFPLYALPPLAGQVSVPGELLHDLHDLAVDAAEHHRAAMGDYRKERQSVLDKIVSDARALLATPSMEVKS